MTTAATKLPPLMTVAEFLAWDGGGHVGKLELIDGVVRAMAPASGQHAIIQANLARIIGNHLPARTSQCRVGTEAPVVPPLRRKINARAPDLAVTCSPLTTEGTFADPVLIVEILSPSNEDDTWESIRALAPYVSLTEILVLASTKIETQIWRRLADGNWQDSPETIGAGGTIKLDSIDLLVLVDDVYEGAGTERGK